MKENVCLAVVLCLIAGLHTIAGADRETLPLSPYPNSYTVLEGSFALPGACKVYHKGINIDPGVIMRIKFSSADSRRGAHVYCELDEALAANGEESYRLKVTPEGVLIKAPARVGVFRGLQTLAQIYQVSHKTGGVAKVSCLSIEDAPLYAWRGLMLDVSRHFAELDEVKQTLDYMAAHKMNRFHWHLTDSPGWRIEIKKYPRLTEVGSKGNHADKNAPSKFYTQEQIKEVVAYAKARHITVIPEIDMPGHANAAIRAYPELSGGPSPKGHFTFNPASAKVDKFLQDVIDEVVTLFPEAPVFHFGGDESHYGWHHWPKLPEVQALMKEKGYKNLTEVDMHFNRKMAKYISGKHDLIVGGWDEVSRSGTDKEKTLLFWWRHDKRDQLVYGLEKGYPVVLCPRIPTYFDFVQHSSHKQGRRWAGQFCTLDMVYAFPKGLQEIEGKQKQVRGIQACLWTEVGETRARREFLTYPRLHALAEAGWTEQESRDFKRFRSYISHYALPELSENGIRYFDVSKPFVEVGNEGNQLVHEP